MNRGPLAGKRVVEFAGLGPGPFAGMLLADLGADVILVDRPNSPRPGEPTQEFMHRGKRSILLDLKCAEDVAEAHSLVESADALIEGLRPGVMERLGLGPTDCHARNPRLVYGRMTGWGQTGTLTDRAGHDINYLALSGALHAIGTESSGPVAPLNLVGDFGGGGMLLALGIVSALLYAQPTGQGQVVDASVLDGSAVLMAQVYSRYAMGLWRDQRASNLLDGGTPYYRTYKCADGEWVAVGAIEQQFFDRLLLELGIEPDDYGDRRNRSEWQRQSMLFANIFASRTRDEWCAQLESVDVCVSPVLSLAEVRSHPHNASRGVFRTGAHIEPTPAPRFSVTGFVPTRQAPFPGEHGDEIRNELKARG